MAHAEESDHEDPNPYLLVEIIFLLTAFFIVMWVAAAWIFVL